MPNLHAVIIDDDANNLEVLANLLTMQGITHTAVQDPTKIDMAIKGLPRIDIIFCDLEMPHLDGYTMLTHLRQKFGTQTPIITYSVHSSEIDNARRMGFDGFIGKPLDADQFPKYVKRILNRQPVWELP